MNPVEDFPTPFPNRHLKSRNKHSCALHSASETKPLLPTDECEGDAEHKHMGLVLSSPQHHELIQAREPFVSNGVDIPLKVLPTHTTPVSHVTNRPVSNLHTSASDSDIKAAVSNKDTGYTVVFSNSKPFSYAHGHTGSVFPQHVFSKIDPVNIRINPDVDSVNLGRHSSESRMEAPIISTSQSENCHEGAPLIVPVLQAGDLSKQYSSIADSCLSSVTQNHPIEIIDDHNTSENSNLSSAVTANSSPSQEDEVSCLLNSSCPSDGNKRTTQPLQPPSNDSCYNAGICIDLTIPQASYVRDQCTVDLLSEEKESVQVFVPQTISPFKEPDQIRLIETNNFPSVSDHNKVCLNNTNSPFLNYPHSGSFYVSHTSPTHQIDKHSQPTSMEESTLQLKDRISDDSYAYHVKADTDINHTSSDGAFPNNTQAVNQACLYPSISDKLDICICGKSFRIHYPHLLNNHGSDPKSTKDNDCRLLLSEKPQSTDHGQYCNRDFISTAPYSKRLIDLPTCGCGEADNTHAQHIENQEPACLTRLPETSNGTNQCQQSNPYPPGSTSMHTNAHGIHCNTTPTPQGPYSLHSCSVHTFTSPLPSGHGDMVPNYIKPYACYSPKTTNFPPVPCGSACHCNQNVCNRTLTPGENSINNIHMVNRAFTPEIKLRSDRACCNANVLESQENVAGCKRDHERNSVISSIDSGHPVNKDGSLPRSNTSEVGLLKVSENTSSDREVPNYSILCIVATILNPVFGLAAFLCNHHAQINFRLHRRARANNLYFATITISTVAIFLTLVGAVLLVTHIAVVHSEAKWTATTPSTDECESRLFGYDESLKTFFNIDFQLYCEITKNEKIMNALKRFWVEDIHNAKKSVNNESSGKDCNYTQNGQCGDANSANDTFPDESSSKDSFGDLQPAENHRHSKSSATAGYTPQLSKPSENSGFSHNTILSSNDGPVVPPELEEEYRQYLEGHTRTKVGAGHHVQPAPIADTNLPGQTSASMEGISTTDTTFGSNSTET